MATIEQCMTALQGVLGDLATKPAAKGLDRSLSCRLPDLGQVLQGRLSGGAVRDLRAEQDDPAAPKADIRLTMTSDDLVALTEGRLDVTKAVASRRVSISANPFDLIKLRKLL